MNAPVPLFQCAFRSAQVCSIIKNDGTSFMQIEQNGKRYINKLYHIKMRSSILPLYVSNIWGKL